jgi:hypothetical protein
MRLLSVHYGHWGGVALAHPVHAAQSLDQGGQGRGLGHHRIEINVGACLDGLRGHDV